MRKACQPRWKSVRIPEFVRSRSWKIFWRRLPWAKRMGFAQLRAPADWAEKRCSSRWAALSRSFSILPRIIQGCERPTSAARLVVIPPGSLSSPAPMAFCWWIQSGVLSTRSCSFIERATCRRCRPISIHYLSLATITARRTVRAACFVFRGQQERFIWPSSMASAGPAVPPKFIGAWDWRRF